MLTSHHTGIYFCRFCAAVTNFLIPVMFVISELENMANVEIVNACHSINDGDLHHHHDLEESNNNPDPDGIFTTQHHTVPNPQSADGGATASATGEGGVYGSMLEGCGSCTPDQVDQVRRRVKFFFMDPCSKFKARRHLPWKMFFQFLKIIIITVQVRQPRLAVS